MKSLFDVSDFRVYLKDWIEAQPGRGRGAGKRIAEMLGVSPALWSQVMKGDKPLSLEHAAELSDFLGFSEKESAYWLLLVQLDRAGSFRLREKLKTQIAAIQKQQSEITHRLKNDRDLPPDVKAIYYSSWVYTGLRNLTALPEMNTIERLAEKLSLSRALVSQALDFLLEQGLCRLEDGKITYQSKWIHLPGRDPLSKKHLQNWHLRALQKMDETNEEQVFFTSPMSLSREAALEIRRLLLTTIESVQKTAGPSDSQVVRCLNIDWFEY